MLGIVESTFGPKRRNRKPKKLVPMTDRPIDRPTDTFHACRYARAHIYLFDRIGPNKSHDTVTTPYTVCILYTIRYTHTGSRNIERIKLPKSNGKPFSVRSGVNWIIRQWDRTLYNSINLWRSRTRAYHIVSRPFYLPFFQLVSLAFIGALCSHMNTLAWLTTRSFRRNSIDLHMIIGLVMISRFFHNTNEID